MNVREPRALMAAAEAASRAWAGVDDVQLDWSITRVTSHGGGARPQEVAEVRGVEGADGGFWVDARVFVSDDQVGHSIRVDAVPIAELFNPYRDDPPERTLEQRVELLEALWNKIEDKRVDDSLALWFTPQCIRDHFDGDPNDRTLDLSDEDLAEVGRDALSMDALYEAFHRCLVDAVTDLRIRKGRE